MDANFTRDPNRSPIVIFHTADSYEQQQFGQKLQLLGSLLSNSPDWGTGLYYFEEEGKDIMTVPLVEGVFGVIGTPFSITGTTNIDNVYRAIYVHGDYAVNEQLHLSGGLRHSSETKETVIDVWSMDLGFPLIANPFGKEEFDDMSSKVTLAYQPMDNFLTYISYATGFKNGCFTGRYVVPMNALTPFEPETLTSYEFGIKSDWLEDRLRLNPKAIDMRRKGIYYSCVLLSKLKNLFGINTRFYLLYLCKNHKKDNTNIWRKRL